MIKWSPAEDDVRIYMRKLVYMDDSGWEDILLLNNKE